jgi:hypothetical protein
MLTKKWILHLSINPKHKRSALKYHYRQFQKKYIPPYRHREAHDSAERGTFLEFR